MCTASVASSVGAGRSSQSCTDRAPLFHGRPRNPPQPLSHHLHPPGSSLPSPHLLPPTASCPSCPLQGSK
ncbi:hypothetical protein ACFX2F_015410 [Malus domestica]